MENARTFCDSSVTTLVFHQGARRRLRPVRVATESVPSPASLLAQTLPSTRPLGLGAPRPTRHPACRDANRSQVRRDSNIGRVVNGRYRILSRIAGGGMAVVYRAEQLPLGRTCAIKLLRPGWDQDRRKKLRERFFLEASVGARLTSPHTVRVFDFGCDDAGQPFIAMQYVEGRTLLAALAEDGPMSQRRTLSIAYQICKSLREAHTLGFAHRDVKPSNVLLTDLHDQRDFVKLFDFGLVDALDDCGEEDLTTHSGLLIGSPEYMAPEQARGESVDGRADIYALGLLMFEMLTGRNPMDRGNTGATLMAQVETVPPRPVAPPQHDPITPELEALIHLCLAKQREDRFSDVVALMSALRAAFARSMATSATPPD